MPLDQNKAPIYEALEKFKKMSKKVAIYNKVL